MNKLVLATIASFFIAGCSSSIDKEITLIKGETTIKEVENNLGSPAKKIERGDAVFYDYTSSHTGRDITTGLLLGWQFLDNHILTLCDEGKTNCKVFKAKEGEDAKSLRIHFEKGVVYDASLKQQFLYKTLILCLQSRLRIYSYKALIL